MNIEQIKQDLTAQIKHMERIIEDKQGEICTCKSSIETFEYEVSESDFDDFLDDIEESVTIAGMTFQPSEVLKSCDPIAYRCAKSDYESNYDLEDVPEYKELLDELESLESELSGLESELQDLENELDNL